MSIEQTSSRRLWVGHRRPCCAVTPSAHTRNKQTEIFVTMPHLLAALSPDASRMAILQPTPGASIRVQVLQAKTATLQSTLLHRRKETSDTLPQKLLFISDSLIAAYCTDLIVVWDLHRGVEATTLTPKKNQVFRDAVHNDDNKLYVLIWSNETQKGQIHCFQPTTGQLVRKVKAGKQPVHGLAVTGQTAVVRHDTSLRVVDVTNGKKLGKYTSLQASSSLKTNSTLLASKNLLVVVDGGEALLMDLPKCQRLTSVTLDHSEDSVDLWARNRDEGYYLRVGSKLYSVSQDGTQTKLTAQMGAAPSVDTRIILGESNNVRALLQKGNHFQTCHETLGDNSATLTLDWIDPETQKTVAKRKEETAVIGPSQAGGTPAAMSDGPASKKQRLEKLNEDEVQMDEDDLDEPDESEQGPSIAERLRKLQEALDAEEDEDGDDEEDGNKLETDFQPKKATTESLLQLLEQALQSSDDGMLEMALRVRDAKVLKESCNSLSDDRLLTLLNALTARLAARPTRANELHPWISAVLLTGRARSIPHLQPLRNILEERVAVFPALLKLEGRLSMMTNQ